jgi:hypothetical protein
MSTQTQVARTICTKKSFATSAAAETFASELQIKFPTQARQSAYPCEDCPNWHLSAMDTAAHAMSQSRVNISSHANFTWAPKLHKNLQHLQSKIKEVYQQYANDRGDKYGAITHVCDTLGIEGANPRQSVRLYLTEIGLHTPNPIRVEARSRANNPTIEGLESKEQELERQLHEIQAKKQALIEAKAIKITNMVNNEQQSVVVIRKEGMSLVVSQEDAFVLVEKLEAHLAALEAA